VRVRDTWLQLVKKRDSGGALNETSHWFYFKSNAWSTSGPTLMQLLSYVRVMRNAVARELWHRMPIKAPKPVQLIYNLHGRVAHFFFISAQAQSGGCPVVSSL
jgi:hypothetical protein